jgi:hypothetical protein
VIVIGHAIGESFTSEIWRMFLAGIPGVILGLLAGIALDKIINPVVFRKIVLVLLLVMGIKIIF